MSIMHDEELNDNLDDRDLPDESDMDDDPDGPATTDCPYCGQEIICDADWCPHCRSNVSQEDAPPNRRWIWYVGIAVLILGAVMLLRSG
jgi:hypothetical protein